MKKILAFILIMGLCFTFASCSAATITGEPATYTNPNQTFSIDLPTSEEKEEAWVINEEAGGNVLDMTDYSSTVRIQIQCLSKAQLQDVAPDFAAYQTYATANTFSDFLPTDGMQETTVEVPKFVTASVAKTGTFKGAQELILFMESEKCYYTCLIMVVEDVYDANEQVLLESILTMQELTKAP